MGLIPKYMMDGRVNGQVSATNIPEVFKVRYVYQVEGRSHEYRQANHVMVNGQSALSESDVTCEFRTANLVVDLSYSSY